MTIIITNNTLFNNIKVNAFLLFTLSTFSFLTKTSSQPNKTSIKVERVVFTQGYNRDKPRGLFDKESFIYYYKNFTLYQLQQIISYSYKGQKSQIIKKPFYILSDLESDSLYFYSDSLKFYKALPKKDIDSIIKVNTLIFSNVDLDTTQRKLIRIHANRRKCKLIFGGVASKETSPFSPEFSIIHLSKKKLSIKHKILPLFDNYLGMRTYKNEYLGYDKTKKANYHFNLEIMKYTPSKERRIFIANFLDSAVANNFRFH